MGAFSKCTSLTSITLPPSVRKIENNAFLNCMSLTSIDIPLSVTGIGFMAFYGTKLTEVTISRGTKFVESGRDATFLESVQINYRD
jgi:type VI protein secretion system component Hcp